MKENIKAKIYYISSRLVCFYIDKTLLYETRRSIVRLNYRENSSKYVFYLFFFASPVAKNPKVKIAFHVKALKYLFFVSNQVTQYFSY